MSGKFKCAVCVNFKCSVQLKVVAVYSVTSQSYLYSVQCVVSSILHCVVSSSVFYVVSYNVYCVVGSSVQCVVGSSVQV